MKEKQLNSQEEALFDSLETAAWMHLCNMSVPAGFSSRTEERFAKAIQHRFYRRLAMISVGAVALCSPLLWLALLHFKTMAVFAAGTLRAVFALMQVGVTLWSYLPEGTLATVLVLQISLIVSLKYLRQIGQTALMLK